MNWGIIGYGEIAPNFIESLLTLKDQCLYAIASRSKHNILKNINCYPGVIIYSDYSDIYNDLNIDIIYICTTNNLHKENVISSLRSGKHVLCEKPIVVCQPDILEIVNTAKQTNKFLMEGMWTRFLPAYKEFIKLIRNGAIGNPKFINVDFGFYSNWGLERRLLNKDLYGGAVLDNTDYNIFLSQDVFNELPNKILSTGNIALSGVENMCSILMKFSNEKIAQSFSSFVQKTKQDAVVYGDKGTIILKEFWHGTKITLLENDKESVCYELPFRSTGFVHEIEEVVDCINKRKIESSIIPHQLSIDIAGVMDEILRQVRK